MVECLSNKELIGLCNSLRCDDKFNGVITLAEQELKRRESSPKRKVTVETGGKIYKLEIINENDMWEQLGDNICEDIVVREQGKRMQRYHMFYSPFGRHIWKGKKK